MNKKEWATSMLMRWVEKRISPAMEFWLTSTLLLGGFALLASGTTPWWGKLISSYVGINVDESFNWLEILILIVGILCIIAGAILGFIVYFKKKPAPVIQVRHNSIERNVIFENVTEVAKHISVLKIDQYSIMANNAKDFQSIKNALRLLDQEKRAIQSIVDSNGIKEMQYYGLAHIPLTFLLGYQLSDKFSKFSCREYNQNNRNWVAIHENALDYPPLHLRENLETNLEFSGDVIVKISITMPVLDNDLVGLPLDNPKVFNLTLDTPTRFIVKSDEQIQDYVKKFRKLMDDIRTHYPNRKAIRVFCSAQPSLCLSLGACLSERMDSNVYIYNYINASTIKYPWAVKLFKNEEELSSSILINLEGGV